MKSAAALLSILFMCSASTAAAACSSSCLKAMGHHKGMPHTSLQTDQLNCHSATEPSPEPQSGGSSRPFKNCSGVLRLLQSVPNPPLSASIFIADATPCFEFLMTTEDVAKLKDPHVPAAGPPGRRHLGTTVLRI